MLRAADNGYDRSSGERDQMAEDTGMGLPKGLTVLGALGPEGEIEEQMVDDPETDRPTVLLTGARSELGKLLWGAWRDVYDIIALDPRPGGPEDLEPVDLAIWDEEWPALFEGVDVVVHLDDLAGPESGWDGLIGPCLDATANVLNAAGLSGVQRVVFGSDWRVMGGHDGERVDESMGPRPVGAYGACKAAAERFGKAAAAAFELEFVVLRMGARPGAEGSPLGSGSLTEGDLVALFTAAVEMNLPDSDFLVIHAVPGWPGEKAAELLGFGAAGGEE